MAVQSLYRRYRPRTFGQVRGQDHVVTALRNAVRTGTEGHAYLFSGPRGTGKTTSARILAKALNCEHLLDGEPCGECASCVDIDAGRSFDLFELDAASNNGVDAIRGLVERSVVGSPGRTKVYILDEVHMLSTGASNALLKTLEEPPEHVCFVLATTDPQKVLPTIRSRTQHYEFQLLSAEELTDYVRWIIADAELDVDEAAVAHVVRQGRGSARDTLSALDQVVAAGGVVVRAEPVAELMDAMAAQDSGAAIAAVAEALNQGSDPRVLGDALLGAVRNAFLISVGVDVPHLVDADKVEAAARAERLGTAALTRAMDAIGSALVDMRQAADPRVPLEVALVRLTARGDTSVEGLAARIDALEQALAGGAAPAAPVRPAAASATPEAPSAEAPAATAPAATAPAATAPAAAAPAAAVPPDDDGDEAPSGGPAGPAQARAALRSRQSGAADGAPARPAAPKPSSRRPAGPGPAPGPPPTVAPARPAAAPPEPDPRVEEPAAAAPAPAEPVRPEPEPVASEPAAPAPAASTGGLPDRDALVLAFGDSIVPTLKGLAKAIYSNGRFVSVSEQGAVFALENEATRQRAEKYRQDVEAALAAHFGVAVPLLLVDRLDVEDQAPRASASTAPKAGAGATPSGGRDRDSQDRAQNDPPATDADDDEDAGIIDLDELEDAVDVETSGLDKLTKAFPGAVLVEDGEGSP